MTEPKITNALDEILEKIFIDNADMFMDKFAEEYPEYMEEEGINKEKLVARSILVLKLLLHIDAVHPNEDIMEPSNLVGLTLSYLDQNLAEYLYCQSEENLIKALQGLQELQEGEEDNGAGSADEN